MNKGVKLKQSIAIVTLIGFFLGGSAPISVSAEDGMVIIPRRMTMVADPLTGVPVEVTVDPFAIAKTEVTQWQYTNIMGVNPSFHRGEDNPVENVSWHDAVLYCNRLSEREGLEPCYDPATGLCDYTRNGYRLPTDAEWSAADSIGATSGDDILRFANLGSANTKSVTEMDNALAVRGTLPTGSLEPNAYGLFDMTGNVWEWCGDYADPQRAPMPFHNPTGPSGGVARVIRGGSYMSMRNSWSRGYRSSMRPDHRSRFTGFRIARTVPGDGTDARRVYGDDWYRTYNDRPAGYETDTGDLSPLLVSRDGGIITSADAWIPARTRMLETWLELLGPMPDHVPPPHAETIEEFRGNGWTGRLMYLDVERDFSEKILVLTPDNPVKVPSPVVIVPYYDVDVPAGMNLGGRTYMPPGVRAFAELAAREGFIAIAVRWFGESYGESYGEAVAELRLRHPGLTGLGKWVWDARRLVDYIGTMPEADAGRIGIIGHSLGGKMSLYAAAFDERISVAVASELGIGLAYSNYDDFWYFGDFIRTVDPSIDHHQLLALIAPRPFLLIGGDEYDTDTSWRYINAAEGVYRLYGCPLHIGYFNHRTGHTPSPEAVRHAMDWLKRFLME